MLGFVRSICSAARALDAPSGTSNIAAATNTVQILDLFFVMSSSSNAPLSAGHRPRIKRHVYFFPRIIFVGRQLVRLAHLDGTQRRLGRDSEIRIAHTRRIDQLRRAGDGTVLLE